MTLSRFAHEYDQLPPGAEGAAYLWARTVACPTTGKPVPLSPSWWLRAGKEPVAVKLIAEQGMSEPRFEIVTGAKAKSSMPDVGTVTRGVGRSPWTGETIDGDYIKAEAQAGRMGYTLFAVATKSRGGFDFHSPTNQELKAAQEAQEALANNLPRWEASGLVPHEPRQAGRADWGAEIYGLKTWADTFAPRQLLSMCTIAEALGEIKRELYALLEKDYANALVTYLCIAFDKAIDYNSTQAVWDVTRQKIAHAFQRHDFAFKWTFGEFDAASNLLPWALEQAIAAYGEIAKLVQPLNTTLWRSPISSPITRLTITQGNASDLRDITNGSISHICVDPPYYDNVQYAEL